MAKGKTPLYLSYVDSINKMLDIMKFEPELPTHKRSIDRSGRNVDWLRKAFKRGTLARHPEFPKLLQLLEVPTPEAELTPMPYQKPVVDFVKGGIPAGEIRVVSAHTSEEKHQRQAKKHREFAMNYGEQDKPVVGARIRQIVAEQQALRKL